MKIVIIGNGISGITAARHLRKNSDHDILVISGESDYFFSRTALMYIYMGHMKFEHTQPYENDFWAKNRISLLKAWVKNIDFDKKLLQLTDGKTINYDKLLLTLGSKPNKFGWPGENLTGVQGLYSLQDLENLESRSEEIERAVIVGGGLIGIELAEMLHSRQKEVTMLVRESSFWNNVLPPAESEMINRHIRKHGIDLRLSTELREINGTQSVESITTNANETIPCQMVGLTVGVSPNVDFLRPSSLEIDRGILVNDFLETNIPDVYAAGDCVQHRQPPPGRRAVEQIWYTGRIMGRTVARNLLNGRIKYQPGVFFNSAKFFDIEYQTYGTVEANPPDTVESFYWQHPEKDLLLRINFEKSSQKVVGVNAFGMRLRHEVWDAWLSQEIEMDTLMTQLQSANFDPEFYPDYGSEILKKYNTTYNRHVTAKTKKRFFGLIP